jgi:AAA ATPase domain
MGAVAEYVPVLLEREAELARVSALLAGAAAGRGAVVVAGGPAGIGKTALLAAVRERAGERGFRVLAARGRELEAGMAFAVARQLVEAAVLSAGAGERRRLLAGPARAGAGALGLAAGAAPDSEFAAVHGLYWLCLNLAGRAPLLVAVDDVQWADGPSLAWLGYLGHRAAELPVLVVVSVREGDPAAAAPPVAAVVDAPGVHRVGLRPLTAEGVTALVRTDLGWAASAGFCAACGQLSGGNPLYVRELLAAARGNGLTGSADDAAALRAAAPITLTPAGEHATLLRLAGAYRPPLGSLGAGIDRVILHRGAAATIRAFISRVADAIAPATRVAGTLAGNEGGQQD